MTNNKALLTFYPFVISPTDFLIDCHEIGIIFPIIKASKSTAWTFATSRVVVCCIRSDDFLKTRHLQWFL